MYQRYFAGRAYRLSVRQVDVPRIHIVSPYDQRSVSFHNVCSIFKCNPV